MRSAARTANEKTPGVAEPHVLDTSALLALLEDEEGADTVERVLHHEKVFVSFISLMEFLYVKLREQGEERAGMAYALLKAMPIHVVESDEELCMLAAHIKAAHRLSLADAWIAATAERLGAILVHKDPEFDAFTERLKMLRLPAKPGRIS